MSGFPLWSVIIWVVRDERSLLYLSFPLFFTKREITFVVTNFRGGGSLLLEVRYFWHLLTTVKFYRYFQRDATFRGRYFRNFTVHHYLKLNLFQINIILVFKFWQTYLMLMNYFSSSLDVHKFQQRVSWSLNPYHLNLNYKPIKTLLKLLVE